MRFTILPVCLLAGLALSACDKRIQQQVAVAATRGAVPASGVEVRLYRLQQCQGEYVRSTLATDGTAAFARTVEIGGVSVITDELSVCVEVKGSWKPLFSSLHGPAPARIDLTCDLSKTDRPCAIRFDDRPLDDLSGREGDAYQTAEADAESNALLRLAKWRRGSSNTLHATCAEARV